jgi:hypothetical protein
MDASWLALMKSMAAKAKQEKKNKKSKKLAKITLKDAKKAAKKESKRKRVEEVPESACSQPVASQPGASLSLMPTHPSSSSTSTAARSVPADLFAPADVKAQRCVWPSGHLPVC